MNHIVVYEENDLMRALLEEWLGEVVYRLSAVRRGSGVCVGAWPCLARSFF